VRGQVIGSSRRNKSFAFPFSFLVFPPDQENENDRLGRTSLAIFDRGGQSLHFRRASHAFGGQACGDTSGLRDRNGSAGVSAGLPARFG
jgi:hypothetical protein